MPVRIESDFLGEREIPNDVYYGVQTLRGIENFKITGLPVSLEPFFVQAFGYVKKAAALANRDLGVLDPKVAEAIVQACDRLIAGEFAGTQGPARTFTPIDVWDLRLNAGKPVTLDLHAGRNTALVILRGTVLVNGEEVARQGQLALFERDGTQLVLESNDAAKVLLLSGEPIDEPIVGHGPFVMNTEQEIHQAFADFQSGKFGQMHA